MAANYMLMIFTLINIFTLFISFPISVKYWIEDIPRDALITSALCILSFSLLFLYFLPLYWGLIP